MAAGAGELPLVEGHFDDPGLRARVARRQRGYGVTVFPETTSPVLKPW